MLPQEILETVLNRKFTSPFRIKLTVLSGGAWVLDLYFGRELSGAGVVINDVYVDVR